MECAKCTYLGTCDATPFFKIALLLIGSVLIGIAERGLPKGRTAKNVSETGEELSTCCACGDRLFGRSVARIVPDLDERFARLSPVDGEKSPVREDDDLSAKP
jgi:hypothetical protein